MQTLTRFVIILACLAVILACGSDDDVNLTLETKEAPAPATLEIKKTNVVDTGEGEVPPDFKPVASLRNEDFTFVPAKRIMISEVELVLDAARLLVETNWDGDKETPLPIKVEDFDQAKLEAYIADETEDVQALIIPPDLEPLYISPEAAEELQQLIVQSRNEYLAYLTAKGGLQQYVDEIDNVMPADPKRMLYHPENVPDVPPTGTEGLVVGDDDKDYSRLQMNVYPADIYNRVGMLQKLGILGAEPTDADARMDYQRQLRDMSTRQLIYHEMTHAVQRAYINLHVPEEERTRKSAWIYATKALTNVDTRYHWLWGGGIFMDMNNRHVSDESQADGISFEIFAAIYDMGPVQRDAVWDCFFGRLEGAQQSMEQIRALFEEHYPEFSLDEFGDPLAVVLDDYPDSQGRNVLKHLTFKFAGFPAYVGYFNPMLPQDTEKFWEALRNP
ncbi:MAG: hypothetical protein JXA21_01525 [Anaerolineae bacterium]|nr:hypothetical protein [Anaerolineae bacterium]